MTPPTPQHPKPGAPQEAMMAIAAFEQSPAPGVWQSLDKKVILAEMRDRVQNPFKIKLT